MRDGNYSNSIDVLYINSGEYVRVHTPASSPVDATQGPGPPASPLSPCSLARVFPAEPAPPRLMSVHSNVRVAGSLGLNLTQLLGHYTHPETHRGAFTPRRHVLSDLPLELPTSARDVKCEHVSSRMSSKYWEGSFFGNPLNAHLLLLAADGSVGLSRCRRRRSRSPRGR